jgi:hypothetical protein
MSKQCHLDHDYDSTLEILDRCAVYRLCWNRHSTVLLVLIGSENRKPAVFPRVHVLLHGFGVELLLVLIPLNFQHWYGSWSCFGSSNFCYWFATVENTTESFRSKKVINLTAIFSIGFIGTIFLSFAI